MRQIADATIPLILSYAFKRASCRIERPFVETSMNWQTASIPTYPPADGVDPGIGLADMRRGLYTIVFGYLLFIGNILAIVGLYRYSK